MRVTFAVMLLFLGVALTQGQIKQKIGGPIKNANGKERLAQTPAANQAGAKGIVGKPKSGNADEVEDDDASLDPKDVFEVDQNGIEINIMSGPNNEKKHKKDFQTTTFGKKPAANVVKNGTRPGFQKQEMNKDFSDGVNVTFEWLQAEQDGFIEQDGENDTIKAGSLKLTLKIQGWKFCGKDRVCNGTGGSPAVVSNGLKVCFDVKPRKSKGTAALSRVSGRTASQSRGMNKPDKIDLGSNGACKFSFKALLDDNWVTLGTNDITIANKTVCVKFPRFNSTFEYDPTLELGDEPDSSSANILAANAIAAILLVVITML